MSDEPVKRGPGRPRKNPPAEEETKAPRIEEAKDGSLMVEVEPTEEGMVPVLLLKNYKAAQPVTIHSKTGQTRMSEENEKLWAGWVVELPEDEARNALKNNICDRAGSL